MVLDELEKFENVTNESGTISSYSSEDLLNEKGQNFGIFSVNSKTSNVETNLPSTRLMQ